MKKYFSILFALIMAMTFAACSESSDDNNNNNNNDSEAKYKDASYGTAAYKSCEAVTTEMDKAYNALKGSELTAEQQAELSEILKNMVNATVIPTYTKLADAAVELQSAIGNIDVNNLQQSNIDAACTAFKKARKYWEQSEAFLGGAASDFDIDPTIDSWPLNRSLLANYFSSGTYSEEALEDGSILGFHALEFILFRNGQNRNVNDFKNGAYDTYKGFTTVKAEEEFKYVQAVIKELVLRTYQLQVAWEGSTTANAARRQALDNAQYGYTTSKGLSYGENLTSNYGSTSSYNNIFEALQAVLNADEGSCSGIANEVGAKKIANPFANGYVFYVESPYSYNSITDFQDNMRSIQNVWYGAGPNDSGNEPTAATHSFYNFFKNNKSAVNTSVVNSISTSISNIGNMPAPFVKYCSIYNNIAFEDSKVVDIPE